MRTTTSRTVAIATAAAMALTSFGFTPALAASGGDKEVKSDAGTAATELSSRRRHRGNAAALGMFAAIGGIAALAASRMHRDEYYYGYPNGYYADPGYAYYPGPYNGGRRVYGWRGGHWHHHYH